MQQETLNLKTNLSSLFIITWFISENENKYFLVIKGLSRFPYSSCVYLHNCDSTYCYMQCAINRIGYMIDRIFITGFLRGINQNRTGFPSQFRRVDRKIRVY